MYSANQLTAAIDGWKRVGMTKAELTVKIAEFCMGWPYVWGALGEECTVEKRRAYMNRDVCPAGDKELIRKRCQVLSGLSSACHGCKYYPNDFRTRIFDCRGFTRKVLEWAGCGTIQGGGATSQYNTDSNWSRKGPISEMPLDQVCCVFKQVNGRTMDHTGLHVGNGRIIHCSVEVKEGKITDKGWTHYAIPKGISGVAPEPSPAPTPSGKPTLRRGSTGTYVKELQEKLIKLGYNLGSYGADGKFGVRTEEAVKEFQKSKGLGTDGIVGSKTWEALDKAEPSPQPVAKKYTAVITDLTDAQVQELKSKYSKIHITEA